MNQRIAGLMSGTVATAPMTIMMLAAHKALPPKQQYPLPPREITMLAARAVRAKEEVDVPGRRTASTLVAHFGVRCACRLVFSFGAGMTGQRPPSEGVLYGLGVWASNYLGILPSLGLCPPTTWEPWR